MSRYFLHLSSPLSVLTELCRHTWQDGLTKSRNLSVAIGLLNCANHTPTGTCGGVNSAWTMCGILYAGPYSPVAPNAYESFTVTVPPENFQLPGPAIIIYEVYTFRRALHASRGKSFPAL